MTYLEDSKIIDLFFARSEQAIDELDKAHGAAVRKTAGNILRDRLDVEEIVNDTYLGVWNSIPPHRPEPLVSFVCRIARNQAVSRLRGKKAAALTDEGTIRSGTMRNSERPQWPCAGQRERSKCSSGRSENHSTPGRLRWRPGCHEKETRSR